MLPHSSSALRSLTKNHSGEWPDRPCIRSLSRCRWVRLRAMYLRPTALSPRSPPRAAARHGRPRRRHRPIDRLARRKSTGGIGRRSNRARAMHRSPMRRLAAARRCGLRCVLGHRSIGTVRNPAAAVRTAEQRASRAGTGGRASGEPCCTRKMQEREAAGDATSQ